VCSSARNGSITDVGGADDRPSLQVILINDNDIILWRKFSRTSTDSGQTTQVRVSECRTLEAGVGARRRSSLSTYAHMSSPPWPQLNLDSCLRVIRVALQDQESATSGAWLKPAGGIFILFAPETLLRTLFYPDGRRVKERKIRWNHEAHSDLLTTAANADSCSERHGEPSARRQIKSSLIMA
jgi:hypothetical protein